MPLAVVIVVSDRVYAKQRTDSTSQIIHSLLPQYTFIPSIIVPDDISLIQAAIRTLPPLQLILTTGGTGFSSRDVTPEAISPLLHRLTPHIITCMLLPQFPRSSVSRGVAGIRNNTLIITLPGSSNACKECITNIAPILSHAIDIIQNHPEGEKLHSKMNPDYYSTAETKESIGHSCIHSSNHSKSSLISHHTIGFKDIIHRHRSSPFPMIPFEDALSIIVDHAKKNILDTIMIKVDSVLQGHVLASNVESKMDVPGFRASVVDGYAVIGMLLFFFLIGYNV